MEKIFIVEDDREIVTQLEHALRKRGFDARGVKEFNSVMLEFSEYNPQIVLMDLYLPIYDGYYWTSKIRTASTCPIIFISSAETRTNAITSMNTGADDYIEKPFDIDILIAKIRALLRRSYDFTSMANTLSFGLYKLDLINSQITIDDKKVDLTAHEFVLMKKLFENQNHTVTKSELMQALWNTDNFVDDNALQVSMGRLRKKLAEIYLDRNIHTHRGKGYILEKWYEVNL